MFNKLFHTVRSLLLPYSTQHHVRMMRYKVHITLHGVSLCGHAKKTLHRTETLRQWKYNGSWHTGTCKHCLQHIGKDDKVIL